MRRYDDPVEVRRGPVSGWGAEVEGPEQFLWRGRLWKVRAVLAHWVETGPWWQSAGAQAVIGSEESTGVALAAAPTRVSTELLAERELWRVEAGRGSWRPAPVGGEGGPEPDGGGVFDLSFDWTDGRSQLVGCAD